MGTYLNPGKEQFERAVHSDIFVDKALLIKEILDRRKRYRECWTNTIEKRP